MNYKQLQKELNEQILSPLYLFINKDAYIANSYVNAIKSMAVTENFAALNYSSFRDKNTDAAEVLNALNTLPVMAQRRLVLVAEDSILKNTQLAKALAEYMPNYCPSSVLVVMTNEIDKRTSFYKAFERSGKVVVFDKLSDQELHEWIIGAFKKRGFKIEPDALKYFMDAGEYQAKEAQIDLGYFANEVDKLCLYKQPADNIVTVSDIKAVSSANISQDMFLLTDYIIAADPANALNQLYRLNYNKVAPQLIIAGIAGAMRRIALCQYLSERDKHNEVIAREQGMHPYAVKKAVEASKTFSVKDAMKATLVIAETDMYIKSGVYDAETALYSMVSDLSAKSFMMAYLKS